MCLRSEHRETNFWSSWESMRTPTRVKLTLGNVNNGFTLWNNKILPKIKLENKSHTKLNVRTLVGASGSLRSGSVPEPQPGAGQLRGDQDSPVHLSREGPRLGWDMCLQVRDQDQDLQWEWGSEKARPYSPLRTMTLRKKNAKFKKTRSPTTKEASTLSGNKMHNLRQGLELGRGRVGNCYNRS